jgi:hypothetical protein
MNMRKAQEFLSDDTVQFVGCRAWNAINRHLSDHDAEDARLKGMESTIAGLKDRVEDLERINVLKKPGCSEGVHKCECGAVSATGMKPAEPEQMICENAEKCKKECLWKTAEIRNNAGGCRRYMNSELFYDSHLIPLSKFNARKEVEKQEAEKKAEWEKNAVKGATVEIFNRQCPYCGPSAGRCETRVILKEADNTWQHPLWWAEGHTAVCYKCARVIAPPKDERVPEPGDELQIPGYQDLQHVVFVHSGQMHVTNDLGTGTVFDLPRDGMAISRPALQPGEGVEHREHPEWGTGTFVSHGTPGAHFPKVLCFEAILSQLRRVAWNPKLHEGKV